VKDDNDDDDDDKFNKYHTSATELSVKATTLLQLKKFRTVTYKKMSTPRGSKTATVS